MLNHAVRALTLGVVILASLLLGMNFYLLPLGNGRDEVELLQVIDFYHDQHRFPVLPDDWADSSWSAHHPPLYFMLTAALIELGLPDPDSHSYRENRFSDQGIQALSPYNRVALLAEKSFLFPPQGKALTWYALRAFSLVLNLLTMGVVWHCARIFFADSTPWGIPLALAFFALSPTFLQYAVVINNDDFILVFSAVATWLVLLNLRQGFTWQRSLLLGIVLGLGMLTKLFMAPLLLSTGFIYLMRPSRRRVLQLASVAGLVLLISGWWYLRNYQLYGDFSAVNQNEALVRTRRPEALSVLEVLPLLSTWGGNMWLDARLVTAPEQIQAVWSYFLMGLLGLGVLGLGRWKKIAAAETWLALWLMFLPAFGFMMYGASRNLDGTSTTIMRASLPALCLLLAGSMLLWIPPRRYMIVGCSGVILGASLTLGFQKMIFGAQYPRLSVSDDIAHPLEIQFEAGLTLVGYELKTHHIQPEQTLDLKLCWRADQAPRSDVAFTAQLVAPDLPPAAALNGFHGSGRYPSSMWQEHETFCEWLPLKIKPEALQPRVYDLRVGLFDAETRLDLNFIQADGTRNHYLIIDQVGIAQPEADEPEQIRAQVGQWGILEDYQLKVSDEKLTFTLNWFALGVPPASYTYYFHVLDANGQVIAQLDRLPLYPTPFWEKGVQFSDTLELTIPPETASYRFGLYNPDFQRAEWFIDGNSVGDGLSFASNTNLIHPEG